MRQQHRRVPEVVEAMMPYFYGRNSGIRPASIHRLLKAKKAVNEVRDRIAESLEAQQSQDIYFCRRAGLLEADNWAIKETAEAYASKGKHIITSKIEHHAVLHTCQYLERNGYEVTYLDVDENGYIKLDQLKAAIRPDTIHRSLSCLPTMR